MSTVTKCSQVNCLNEGFMTLTPGRACSVSSVQGDRWRRFANLINPVLAHRCCRILLELRAVICTQNKGLLPNPLFRHKRTPLVSIICRDSQSLPFSE